MSSDVTELARLIDAIQLRPIGVDDFAAVRFVHDTAFRAHCASHFSELDAAEFRAHLRSPKYMDELQHEEIIGAWLDGELIGTASWMPADDHGNCARIGSLYVRPLFDHLGVGSLLLSEAEQRARRAGFREFSIRAMPHAIPFLAKAGYEVTSRGVQPFGNVSCAVAFMRKRQNASAYLTMPPEAPALSIAVPGATADLSFPSLALHEREK
ncbi:MAG: GNAT family N-acetyltransferase [Hyphomicrobiaceae bacterium]|nr:MAG: GNAT family N-acetyltransferase [Hyphomicrobiaceae bacterium]